MTCNTCGGWGDYPVAGPYPEHTITREPCPECAMTNYFRADNTEGYSASELAALNDAFEQIMADNWDADANAAGYYASIEYKNWQDSIATKLLENLP
jgi:hypothetical protein